MEKQIIEHACIFLSIPMTLKELSKRTDVEENQLLYEFSYKLYLIDENLANRVNIVLEYLKGHNMLAG